MELLTPNSFICSVIREVIATYCTAKNAWGGEFQVDLNFWNLQRDTYTQVCRSCLSPSLSCCGLDNVVFQIGDCNTKHNCTFSPHGDGDFIAFWSLETEGGCLMEAQCKGNIFSVWKMLFVSGSGSFCCSRGFCCCSHTFCVLLHKAICRATRCCFLSYLSFLKHCLNPPHPKNKLTRQKKKKTPTICFLQG